MAGLADRTLEVTRPVIRIAPGRSDSARGRTFEENFSVTKVDQVVSVLTSNWEYDVVKERFLQSDVDVTMDGGTQGHGEAAEISLWYICDQGSKSVAVQEYLFRAQQDRDIVTINIDPNLLRDLAGFKTNIEVGDTIALTHTVLPSGDGRGVSQGFYRILSVAPNLDVPMSLTLRLQDVLPFKKASTNQAFLNDARILGSNLFAVDHGQMIGAAADLQESTSIDPVHGQY